MNGFARRLLVTVATVAVMGGACSGEPATESGDEAPSAPAATASALASMTPPGVAAPWLAVARGFGRAFTDTEHGRDAWFAALSTWLTDAQADRYRGLPVDVIPAGRLTNVSVDEPLKGRTRGVLSYDTGMVLAVDLAYVDARGSWLVSSIIPLDPGDRSG